MYWPGTLLGAAFWLAAPVAFAQGSPTIIWQQQYNSDRINACVFSPDGGTFITGSSDRLINFWNAADGTLRKTFNSSAPFVHESSIESLAITRDGTRLASTCYKVAKLWTISSGSVINLNGHTDWVVGCAFAPGGGVLATASFDKTIKIWRVSDGLLLRTLTGHSGQVRCCVFSPDGQYLASGAGDNSIRIWRTSDWTTVHILTGHTSDIYAITWSPDGALIGSGGYDLTARLWSTSSWTVQQIFNPGGNVYALGFSPDSGTFAFCNGEANQIQLASVSSGSVYRTFTDNTPNVQCLAFSPQSNALLGYGRADPTVIMSDISGSPPPPPAGAATPTISPDGGTFAGSVDVTLADATSGATIRYTLDGSDPTSASTVYVGPITLITNGTLKARASASGYSDSSVASAFFQISAPPAQQTATPVISPNGGTYSGAVTVSMSDTTAGAVIHYTLDGTAPTSSSPAYSTPLVITSNTTVKARASATGYSDSTIASAVFQVTSGTGTVATPTISPNGGTYSGSVSISIATTTPGATIRYTIDGTDPGTSSALYSSPFTITASAVVKAKALATGMSDSAVATATFTITTPGAVQATAVFVGTDTVTQGNWKGAYGAEGYDIIGDGGSYPAYAQVTFLGNTDFTWVSTTYSRLALQKIASSTNRIAACSYNTNTFYIYFNLTDGKTHRIGFYCLDWDAQQRSETMDVIDATTGVVLNSQPVANFSLGKYVTWDLSGYVVVRITRNSGTNCVISGLFFDTTPLRPVRLQSPTMNSPFHMQIAGNIGETVVVQASTNLTDWISIATNVLNYSPYSYSDTNSLAIPHRFYRATASP